MHNSKMSNTNQKYNIAIIAVCSIFALMLIWQGAFFPLQFIPLLIIPFLMFALSKQPITITLNTILLLGMTLLLLASFLLLAQEPQISLREWLRYLLIPLSLMFFIATKDKSDWYMRAFFAGIFAIALFGLMAYTGGITIPGGIIEHSGRLQSTIQYANVTALLMLIGILYSVDYFIKTKKWRYPIYALGFAYCLYLTGSRVTLVLFFIIAVLFILAKMKRKLQLVSIGILAAVFVALSWVGGRIMQISLTEPTLIERVITWQDGLRIAMYYPWLGLGIGNWQFEQFFYQSAPYGVRYIHNFYAQVLVDGGFLAAILFIVVILNVLWRGLMLKEKNIHFFVILAIAFHIFLDFSMAFGGVILIFAFSMSQIPDKEFKIPSWPKKRLRLVALIPVVLLLVMLVNEPGYKIPDPLGDRFAAAIQAYTDEEYLLAIEKTEALLHLWRFNPIYQAFYYDLLKSAVNSGLISLEEKQHRLEIVEQKRVQINPLYVRYIRRTTTN